MSKIFSFALMLIATLSLAHAQATPPIPLPKPLANSNGEVVGTWTSLGNKLYLRDKQGAFLVTVEIAKDGTRKVYDWEGRVIPTDEAMKWVDQLPTNVTPEQTGEPQ
jgi:hypothetical protein